MCKIKEKAIYCIVVDYDPHVDWDLQVECVQPSTEILSSKSRCRLMKGEAIASQCSSGSDINVYTYLECGMEHRKL